MQTCLLVNSLYTNGQDLMDINYIHMFHEFQIYSSVFVVVSKKSCPNFPVHSLHTNGQDLMNIYMLDELVILVLLSCFI